LIDFLWLKIWTSVENHEELVSEVCLKSLEELNC
jgi:hypothetical protein